MRPSYAFLLSWFLAADEFRPSYHYFDFFYTGEASLGLEEDSVVTSHPLSRTEAMTNLNDIDNQFDDISYSKVGPGGQGFGRRVGLGRGWGGSTKGCIYR